MPDTTLLQVGGTRVPDSGAKDLEDQLLGGCFGVVVLFFIVTGIVGVGVAVGIMMVVPLL